MISKGSGRGLAVTVAAPGKPDYRKLIGDGDDE
jgi:hypothetical protein